MATRTAKLRVQVDGEKEYKQAIADLNKGNQVLASEMRKLQAEYKGSESSIEALNKKGDLLQRQLLQQKDKVQTLRDALKNAAQQYGEADKRTQEWQIKLNDAEAAQAKLEHAIEENNDAIKAQGQALDGENKQMISLGDAVDQVAGKLGVNLPDGAKKALDGMKGMSAGSVAALGAIAAGVAAVIKAIRELNDLTIEAAGRADDLLTRSITTGLSTRDLQAFEYASPFVDVDSSTFENTFSRMPKVMAQAAQQLEAYHQAQQKAAESGKKFEGTLGAQAAAFEALGISITDENGNLRDYHDLVWEAVGALGQYGDTTESAQIAQDLFGKSYADLKPLIQNAEEAQRLMNEAVAEGYVLSEDEIRILGDVDDAKQKQILTLQKWTDQIAVQWAPTTKAGYEMLTKLIDTAGKTLVDSKLVENFGSLVQSTLGLVEAGASLVDMLPQWVNPVQQVSDAFRGLAVVMATVADTINLISGLMPWNWGSGKASTALGWNIGQGQLSNLQQLKYGGSNWTYNAELGAWNASGTENWRGGLTWVGESGPELVALPRGSRIWSNQESQQMSATGTDTSRIEALLERNVQLLENIGGEFSGLRVKRRMA